MSDLHTFEALATETMDEPTGDQPVVEIDNDEEVHTAGESSIPE